MKQLTFFDLIPEEENKEADLCETCRYFVKGCCSYNEPLGRYCVLGDAYEFKVPEEVPQFPESDFAEIVDYIEKVLDIKFNKVEGPEQTSEDDPEKFNYYEYKKRGFRLYLGKGKFFPNVFGGAYYISVGYDISTGGGGSPLDTIDEAIAYFKDKLEKYGRSPSRYSSEGQL